jgi:GNAT superfamily N-acetyltransferase
MSNPILRNLRISDIPVELSTEAGWNQTEEDWCTLIDVAPKGCLAIEVGGELASTATLICYGRLAWVGMVLTRKRFQGQGFARRLLNSALTLADEAGVETVKLDATDQGQPLYEKLGFRVEQPVERWARSADVTAPSEQSIPSSPASEDWLAADKRAFGTDRTNLLTRLAENNAPQTIDNSYLLARPGRITRYLGPCVATSPEIARTLIERALRTPSTSGWSWDLLPENTEAAALARNLAFSPKRRLLRMVRGKDLRGRESDIYAIAGFELG